MLTFPDDRVPAAPTSCVYYWAYACLQVAPLVHSFGIGTGLIRLGVTYSYIWLLHGLKHWCIDRPQHLALISYCGGLD